MVKKTLQLQDLQTIIAILGIDELSEDQKVTLARARKIQRSCHRPFHVAEQFTGTRDRYFKIADTVKVSRRSWREMYRRHSEQAFYLKGTIDEVLEAAEKLKAQHRKSARFTI